MKSLKLSVLLLIIIAITAFSASAALAAVAEEHDILFCEADGFKLLGDMYVPEGDGPFPGILFVHGGGFVGGDKAWTGQPEHLRKHAERGYVVFSINYRLLMDNVAFQGSIEDTKCGLAWFKANAEKYKTDKNNIAVMGFSAGGYYSAIIAFTQNNPQFQPADERFKDADTSVAAAVMFYPPIDFVTFDSSISSMLEMQIKRIVGIKSKKVLKEYMEKYSPVNYVNNSIPVFLAYTANDGLVPPTQQDELMAAMDKAGTEYEFFKATDPAADHGFITRRTELDDTQEAEKRLFAFLDKHMKSGKK